MLLAGTGEWSGSGAGPMSDLGPNQTAHLELQHVSQSIAPDNDERLRRLTRATRTVFDVLIVGGGINGAGIAHEAARRGLHVLLLEQHDYGFGTTWRSTKLIHGGLRYLEHLEWRLVAEGLRERGALLRDLPALVRPLPFLTPVFRYGRFSRRQLQLGLTAYDLLARGSSLPPHRYLSHQAALALEPALPSEEITGAFTYWDAQVELPERLCWEEIAAAGRHGAVAFNYVQVTDFLQERGRVRGVMAVDRESGRSLELRARTVVNASGPWVDRVLAGRTARGPLLDGTKGTHIVADLSGPVPRRAIYAEAATDGRPFFVVPWRGAFLIGTTDNRFSGDPATVRPTLEEVMYLLDETKKLIPGVDITPAAVRYAFAGVRPLARAPGRQEGAISRRHFVIDHSLAGPAGLYSVTGGKLTSFRSLAREAVAAVVKALGRHLEAEKGRPDHRWNGFAGADGANAEALALLNPSLRLGVGASERVTLADVARAIVHEDARTVGDVLLRRTAAGWARDRGQAAAPAVAALLGRARRWNEQQVAQAVADYQREIDSNLFPLDSVNE